MNYSASAIKNFKNDVKTLSHYKFKMQLLILMGVVIWHVTSTFGSLHCEEGHISGRTIPEALQVVTHSANVFSPNFLSAVAKTMPGNFVCSPISMFLLLSMVNYGARGKTQKQLRTTLAIPKNDDDLVHIGFQTLIESFDKYEVANIRLANKIFLAEGSQLRKKFADITKIAFQSEAQSVNFRNPIDASRIINNWVEYHTNHLIKDLTTPGSLGIDTNLILVSAIYFKGTWAETFNVKKTEPGTFHIDEKITKNVTMMNGVGSHLYGSLPEVKATFLGLRYLSDYNNDTMSMFIILPDKINGLADVENNFDKITIDKLLHRGINSKVSVTLPKFQIESNIQLDGPLKEMGLTKMFSAEANFDGITTHCRLKVNKVIQKAFIEINESGTEAAAAGSADLSNRIGSNGRMKHFVADHAFFIIIATTSKNPVILFAGRYGGP